MAELLAEDGTGLLLEDGSALLTEEDDVVLTAERLATRALRFPDLDPVAELAGASNRRILDPHNEVGSGSLVLHNSDPDLDALEPLDVIQVLLYGQVVFAFLAEEFAPVLLDDGEESTYETTVSGRSVTSLPSWVRIYPGNGIEAYPIEVDRLLSWPAPQYVEDAAWDPAEEVGNATGLVRQPGTQLGYPEGAPDVPGAKWIWGLPGTDSFAPGGTVYVRQVITIATSAYYLFGWAFDNWGTIYIDGQLLGQLEPTNNPQNFRTVHTRVVRLSAGDHTIAIKASNIAPAIDPGGADNPGGIYCIVGTIDVDGTFANVLVWTDSSWSVLAYPPYPPGMTPGEMIRICLEEAQARGALTWVSLGFTDAEDSAGEPWPLLGDVATKTGNDLLTFLGELSGTYIDFAVHPETFVLDAWHKGTHGADTGVPIAPADGDADTGNLRALTSRTV